MAAEADERIEWLEAEAKNQISRLQNELAQATGGTDLVKAEAGKHIESIEMEADAKTSLFLLKGGITCLQKDESSTAHSRIF